MVAAVTMGVKDGAGDQGPGAHTGHPAKGLSLLYMKDVPPVPPGIPDNRAVDSTTDTLEPV